MAESSSRVGQVGQMPLLYRKRRASARESGYGRDIEEVALLPGGMHGIVSRASEEDGSPLRLREVILEHQLEIREDSGGFGTVDRLRSASAPESNMYTDTFPKP